jgi:phosphopantothenoylcysteine decarboxylase/phosphopantothenate--cysteine ligase
VSSESHLPRASVALCITGSIAAYKSVYVARLLLARGYRVIPVMTPSAARFVGPLTLSGITRESVVMDMWQDAPNGELHVDLGNQVDAMVIAPATADCLARLATGRADDLMSALYLSLRTPVVAVAPSMHPRMWAHPSTVRNVDRLRQDGVRFIGPVEGPVASGDVGMGRMAEPEVIVSALEAALTEFGVAKAGVARPEGEPGGGPFAGRRVLVTAGPTYEAIDPVRFLGNRSSGKMGFALAAAARHAGAKVTLIAGPVALDTPEGVTRVDVVSALDMSAAVHVAAPHADVIIMAAAVADYRVAEVKTEKIKKGHGGPPRLELVENPDILAGLGRERLGEHPMLVGFALETGSDAQVIAYAEDKLARKRADMIVANAAAEGLGGDATRVHLVQRGQAGTEVTSLAPMAKRRTAEAIVAAIGARLASSSPRA